MIEINALKSKKDIRMKAEGRQGFKYGKELEDEEIDRIQAGELATVTFEVHSRPSL